MKYIYTTNKRIIYLKKVEVLTSILLNIRDPTKLK